jgi:hypothetical protein
MVRSLLNGIMSLRIYVFVLVAIALIVNADRANAVKSHGKHKGIDLYTSPTKPNTKYDEIVTPNSQALKKIRQAINLIYAKSKYSAGKIDFLKKQGRVIIVYDPHVPDPGVPTTSLLMARFYPTYLRDGDTKGSGSTKDYLVIVTRIGILQDLTDVASTVVHELVGHGIQHQRGRLDTMRILDIECEAWLYEERSYQDFGIDKFSRKMGRFRTQLEDRECSDFRRHQAIKYPKMYKLWDELNPNVPKLLVNFDQYLKDIQGTVTKKALRFSETEKTKNLDKLFSGEDAKAILSRGNSYYLGAFSKPDLK